MKTNIGEQRKVKCRTKSGNKNIALCIVKYINGKQVIYIYIYIYIRDGHFKQK